MNFVTTPYGLEFQNDKIQVFFGNQQANLEFINNQNSKLQVMRIKQTHSDHAVEASSQLLEADAHYTTKKAQALLIATADCLPILIFDEILGIIASVHAGWRGVANRILPKTLEVFKQQGSLLRDLNFFVGPHIRQNSFEVEEDVKSLLQNSLLDKDRITDYCTQRKTEVKIKYYFDLSAIILEQISEMKCENPNIFLSSIDTRTDLNWHSFRRDQQNSGRNLSFIAIK